MDSGQFTSSELIRIKENLVRYGKPFQTSDDIKAFMELEIFWCSRTHGDPENIFGSIADALFTNDKNLDGIFTSQLAPNKLAKVEVGITVLLK